MISKMTISEIARDVLLTQVQEMQLHLDGCIDGQDHIHLHDIRVANRKTRAALIEFRRLLPEKIYQQYLEEFRWFHQVTSQVRDLDVGLSLYPELKKEIPKPWRPHLKPLLILLEEKRKIAQAELSGTLQSERVRDIFRSWTSLLEKGVFTEGDISLESAKEYGCRRITKRYRQLQREGQQLSKKTPAEKFHDYRIIVKKLRYIMEFFRPVMDQEDFEKLRLGLKSVQDTFGFFQDTEIQALSLRRFVDELFEQGVSVDTMLALGQLLGVLGKRLSRGKKECLRQTNWLISEATARAFQTCFQYPVE